MQRPGGEALDDVGGPVGLARDGLGRVVGQQADLRGVRPARERSGRVHRLAREAGEGLPHALREAAHRAEAAEEPVAADHVAQHGEVAARRGDDQPDELVRGRDRERGGVDEQEVLLGGGPAERAVAGHAEDAQREPADVGLAVGLMRAGAVR